MSANSLLSDKAPQEIITVTFSYVEELGVAAIASVSVTMAVFQGSDGAVGTMLLGPAVISGADVYQQVQTGVTGTTYKIECLATFSDGRKLLLTGMLPVRSQY